MGHAVNDPGAREREAGQEDQVITLVGLVLEAAAGLRRHLAPGRDGELGVGGQSFEVLVRLARTPGRRLRMSDIAAQTGLSPGGLTRAVDRLVAAGLAVRESCPNDRRGTFARLTEVGWCRITDALARQRADVAVLLEELWSTEEVALAGALLRRLRDRVHPNAALVTDPEHPPASPPTGDATGDGGCGPGR